jgi:atypical dual specificity phosphatase
MDRTEQHSLVWWVIPGVLAGMPMPFIHPDRRMAGGGALTAFADELPDLYALGVRAVVSLLNIPSDAAVCESAGFSFLCLPVPDGDAPAFAQADEFVRFVADQRATRRPVAVHCEAGLGRTGTLLAAYLIAQGETATAAISRVRAVEKVAVETARQIDFLERYATHRIGWPPLALAGGATYAGPVVKQPRINVEEQIDRFVGRRTRTPDSWQAGMQLQALGVELHKSFQHRWMPKGVYRFTTHEEADAWMIRMLARSSLPKT